LAAAHAMGEPPGGTIEFSTRSGRLSARFDGDGIELDFPSQPPVPVETPGALSDVGALRCARGANFFIAELGGEHQVRALMPDLAAIEALPGLGLIVTAGGDHPATDYVLRMFAPGAGVDEDPVTGSAQCSLAPYWAPRLGKDHFYCVQVSARTGALRVRLDGDRVRISGHAVTIMNGTVS